MADIELVIKIPEEDFKRIKKKFQMRMNIMANAIAHGTPLPKGHGRLIDVSEYFKKEFGDAREFLDKAITIIEADKSAESEVRNDRTNNEKGIKECISLSKKLVD